MMHKGIETYLILFLGFCSVLENRDKNLCVASTDYKHFLNAL